MTIVKSSDQVASTILHPSSLHPSQQLTSSSNEQSHESYVEISVKETKDVIPNSLNPQICKHYLIHKKRRCRMPVKEGHSFCGAHSIASIPCPHCSTSLTDSTKYRRHCSSENPLCPVLKRLARVAKQPWYSKAINFPNSSFQTHSNQNLSISHHQSNTDLNHLHPLPSKYVNPLQVIKLLKENQLKNAVQNLNTPNIPEAEIIHNEWSNTRDSSFSYEQYHFLQIASLASRVLRSAPSSTVTQSITILELGAGRAYTSLYVSHVFSLRNIQVNVIVIDRAASRMKADRVIRGWVNDPSSSISTFRRIRADVSDVDLCKIPELINVDKVYVIGKHVCGAGLDLSLTCVQRLVKERKEKINVSLALLCCCRRLCQWNLFGDDAKIWRKWKFTEEQVGIITKAAAWGLDKKHDETRTTAGHLSRAAVDSARVEWLREKGWTAWTEVCSDQSPENICVCAEWPKKDMSEWISS